MIKFRVWGSLRFLSHAETLRLFQRACVRAGIDVRYSQGFNPRPRLSLPLPRPVGVESDDEVLCLSVGWGLPHRCDEATAKPLLQKIASSLGAQLPEGCELISVGVSSSGASIQPRGATYALTVKSDYLNDRLKAKIESLLASESLVTLRRTGARNRTSRNIDVRPFLASIEMTGEGIIVQCRISASGSIRVDEVLGLLELDQSMLAGPIRRTCVQWQ